MPTYEYICRSCGHVFEEFQSIKDEALLTCPNCGQDMLERGTGGGKGMIFTGSGFYLTDYKGEKKTEGTKKEEKKSPEEKPKTSTEEKPAAPKEKPAPKKDDKK